MVVPVKSHTVCAAPVETYIIFSGQKPGWKSGQKSDQKPDSNPDELDMSSLKVGSDLEKVVVPPSREPRQEFCPLSFASLS